MKTTQILYILLFVGIAYWVLTSTPLADTLNEGFQNSKGASSSEPLMPKGLDPTRLPVQAMPNDANLGPLLYAPYGQTPSVGSFPYKDPSLASADIKQIKKLHEDVKSFLVFEGANISSNSDPTIQLPLTQLRADSRRLQQEISVLENNSGIQSSMTQQDLADIESALSFLQRKVRLFKTSGLVSKNASRVEGFTGDSDVPIERIRATKADLVDLNVKIYSAILQLSASGSQDAVTNARMSSLEQMYKDIQDTISKIDGGTMNEDDIPVYQSVIRAILPNLGKTDVDLSDIFSSGSGTGSDEGDSSLLETQLGALVGKENVSKVFKHFIRKGTFKASFDLGYNLPNSNSSNNSNMVYSKKINLQPDGTMGYQDSSTLGGSPLTETTAANSSMDSAYDTSNPGMDDRAEAKSSDSSNPSGLDWKKRAGSICEQVRLRGLDPLDFGCIAQGSMMSPAYSWRGHTKMVCGRLTATTDPDLPVVCGCPPAGWKGWSLSY